MTCRIKSVRGHFEVYIDGKFYCSADTMCEVINELKEYERKEGVLA